MNFHTSLFIMPVLQVAVFFLPRKPSKTFMFWFLGHLRGSLSPKLQFWLVEHIRAVLATNSFVPLVTPNSINVYETHHPCVQSQLTSYYHWEYCLFFWIKRICLCSLLLKISMSNCPILNSNYIARSIRGAYLLTFFSMILLCFFSVIQL